MGSTGKVRTKRRRKFGKPRGLSLDELGLLGHIRAHLVDGRFEHPNKATGRIFGCDESTISRIVTRLEEKGLIEIYRTKDSRGVWLTAVITPKSPHAEVHVEDCPCYQDLKPSGSVSTCTGAQHTISTKSTTTQSLLMSHAQVHVALDAARIRLSNMRDQSQRNFDQKQNKYFATEVRKARDEVRRLEYLLAEKERTLNDKS